MKIIGNGVDIVKNSRIKRYVQSDDFLEEYKILKGTFKLVDNL